MPRGISLTNAGRDRNGLLRDGRCASLRVARSSTARAGSPSRFGVMWLHRRIAANSAEVAMTVAAPLTTFRLERDVSIAQALPPNSDAVTWDSPALEVMTDLTEVRAATTHPATTLRQAEQMMIYQGVRMLFG